jgi:hypothetical protein
VDSRFCPSHTPRRASVSLPLDPCALTEGSLCFKEIMKCRDLAMGSVAHDSERDKTGFGAPIAI